MKLKKGINWLNEHDWPISRIIMLIMFLWCFPFSMAFLLLKDTGTFFVDTSYWWIGGPWIVMALFGAMHPN